MKKNLIAKIIDDSTIHVFDKSQFDWYAIRNSGQIFRDSPCEITTEKDKIIITATGNKDSAWLWNYFDLGTDYGRLDVFAEEDPFFADCLKYGRGIHVLRQDLWETLITFILSQNSNIPRIQSCIASLVRVFGHFPAPREILCSDSLEEIRCGYRAPYLTYAAGFDLNSLHSKNYTEAKTLLKEIKGVGDKVADCVILFGLHNRRAFPADVWIGRIIEQKYSGKLDLSKFDDLSGIVQQYMFYYAINHKGEFT
jgi:N-glycosylase/DNA lyase